jgi:SpoVK/Ycf46/Vps4 family AAA+-type ATPase
METTLDKFIKNITNELKMSSYGTKRKKVKSILKECGLSRRSTFFVEEFNKRLIEGGITSVPLLDFSLPFDAFITFSIKDNKKDGSKHKAAEEKDHIAYGDLFQQLFYFESEHEFNKFQAALNYNKPVGIFLIPQEEDFFSDIIERLISFNVIKKKQYKGQLNSEDIAIHDEQIHTGMIDSDQNNLQEREESGFGSNIITFGKSTMSNFLFSSNGMDLLETADFNKRFQNLSLYANKYLEKEMYVLFHCPSKILLDQNNREDLLGKFIDQAANNFSATFTLRCKYRNEEAIPQTIKKQMLNSFKILFEIPSCNLLLEELSLREAFIELQNLQVQLESQILLDMDSTYFPSLSWGFESDEHIFLKYFAVKTMHEKRKINLSKINCEVSIPNDKPTKYKKRADVYVENKILVEAETLRGKAFGNDVYLELIKNILSKINGWKTNLEELWLVLPGYEYVRNSKRVKKAFEIISTYLNEKFGGATRLLLQIPDYEKHELIELDINESFIEQPFEQLPVTTNSPSTEGKMKEIFNFSSIKGLKEEKEKLMKLIKLHEKGHVGIISGVLFYGLPGCGKTALAQAFANQSERYFLQFSPADIQSMWIGQSQKNIKDIFEQAKLKSPSVLFIDELDSIAFSRNEQNAHTDQKATINQLLIEMNNIKGHDVIIIGATNMLSSIDMALKRSGRFDWKIPIFPPNELEREELFRYYINKTVEQCQGITDNSILLSDFDFRILARESAKFTSSDIELVCSEIKQSLILGDFSDHLRLEEIRNAVVYRRNQGLSITEDAVEKFIGECKQLNVQNSKLEFLKSEWNVRELLNGR